ncbi:Zn(II)2Cys6 transcription factor [Aspergillus mulundensis]|uniref:Zn(2)-C6 fungal-type domain-containing protein n=1 Tax=Aspergillus mulundensis TaxID=1810919 RepID=A0A3D8T4H9_9EURO|nr:Uncharacterized protein DSM5745_00785 [Aspergillus mulundensis]RDW93463.1 Uncharacterized protein DSM5745_00785 [Aspergillus mulundensis]
MAESSDSSRRKRPFPRGTAFYPRKRANTACQVCRARKTKCDNLKPTCSYCLSVGATCIQSAADLSSFDPASLRILERLDELERIVRQQHETRSATTAVVSPASLPLPPSIHQPDHQPFLASAPLRLKQLLCVAVEPPERLLRLPVFAGFRSLPEAPLIEGPPTRRIPVHMERQASFAGCDTTLPGGIHTLLDNFFEYVHCKNPVLEEAPTRRLVLAVSLEGPDWSARSCLALLVCALGTLATPFGENPPTDTGPGSARYADAQALFQAAQRRMGVLLVSTREEDDLIASQCLLLSGLYLMCILQPFLAWRLFTQALAACQRSPFLRRMYARDGHESAVLAPHGAPSARETQELAIYWSAWKSERELRHCFQLPDFPAAGETGSYLYPRLFPTPPATVSDDLVGEHRQRSSWLFYLAEISLRRLMSRVCREIAALYSSMTSAAAHAGNTEDADTEFLVQLALLIPEYEEQGRRWAGSLPVELSLEAPPADDNVCRFVLRGHYADFREVLYWPFLAHWLGCRYSVGPDQSHPASSPFLPSPTGSLSSYRAPPLTTNSSTPPSWSSTADKLVERCLETQIERIHINKMGFRHRHHGTLLLIWTCIRGVLILFAAKLNGLRMPSGWQDAIACVPDGLLGVWENEMPWLGSWREFIEDVLQRCS